MTQGNKLQFPLSAETADDSSSTFIDAKNEMVFDTNRKVEGAGEVVRSDVDFTYKCKGDVSGKPDRWVCCHDCYRHRKINPSCGQRNCVRCQAKRARMIFEKYRPALERISSGNARRWILVTLTGYRVPREWVGQNVYMIMEKAKKLLQKYFLGGQISVEHMFGHAFSDVEQKGEKGYYIHVHALVIGDYINNRIVREDGLTDMERFTAEWGYFTKVQSLHFDPQGHPRTNSEAVKAGLTYVCKYISKGVALEDSELDQVKRLRYIRTFGLIYKMEKPEWKSHCQFCYDGDPRRGRLGIINEEDVDTIHNKQMQKGDEPLELVRVISWPVKVVKLPLDELKRRYDDLEDWFLRIGRNFRLRTALLRWIYVS